MASTKAFTCQLTALFILAMYLGQAEALAGRERLALPGAGAAAHPRQAGDRALARRRCTKELARKLFRATDFLFLGRGIHFPIALEGALKLKEISYIHAEGYPAGEMKHGPNALIDEKLPVVVLATRDPASDESRMLYEKTLSNIQEVKAREGIVVAVVTEGDEARAQDGRPRDRDPGSDRTAAARSWRSCRCNCWRITSPCAAAATWTSRAIWPRASRLSSGLRQFSHRLQVATRGKGLYEITRPGRAVAERLRRARPAC